MTTAYDRSMEASFNDFYHNCEKELDELESDSVSDRSSINTSSIKQLCQRISLPTFSAYLCKNENRVSTYRVYKILDRAKSQNFVTEDKVNTFFLTFFPIFLSISQFIEELKEDINNGKTELLLNFLNNLGRLQFSHLSTLYPLVKIAEEKQLIDQGYGRKIIESTGDNRLHFYSQLKKNFKVTSEEVIEGVTTTVTFEVNKEFFIDISDYFKTTLDFQKKNKLPESITFAYSSDTVSFFLDLLSFQPHRKIDALSTTSLIDLLSLMSMTFTESSKDKVIEILEDRFCNKGVKRSEISNEKLYDFLQLCNVKIKNNTKIQTNRYFWWTSILPTPLSPFQSIDNFSFILDIDKTLFLLPKEFLNRLKISVPEPENRVVDNRNENQDLITNNDQQNETKEVEILELPLILGPHHSQVSCLLSISKTIDFIRNTFNNSNEAIQYFIDNLTFTTGQISCEITVFNLVCHNQELKNFFNSIDPFLIINLVKKISKQKESALFNNLPNTLQNLSSENNKNLTIALHLYLDTDIKFQCIFDLFMKYFMDSDKKRYIKLLNHSISKKLILFASANEHNRNYIFQVMTQENLLSAEELKKIKVYLLQKLYKFNGLFQETTEDSTYTFLMLCNAHLLKDPQNFLSQKLRSVTDSIQCSPYNLSSELGLFLFKNGEFDGIKCLKIDYGYACSTNVFFNSFIFAEFIVALPNLTEIRILGNLPEYTSEQNLIYHLLMISLILQTFEKNIHLKLDISRRSNRLSPNLWDWRIKLSCSSNDLISQLPSSSNFNAILSSDDSPLTKLLKMSSYHESYPYNHEHIRDLVDITVPTSSPKAAPVT